VLASVCKPAPAPPIIWTLRRSIDTGTITGQSYKMRSARGQAVRTILTRGGFRGLTWPRSDSAKIVEPGNALAKFGANSIACTMVAGWLAT
jgi:hypothetical protein